MAKKKTTRKRSSKKKGMSTLTKVLIGGAVLGGGWLIYDQFFANKETPEDAAKKAAADAAAAAQAAMEGQAAAGALNKVDPGTGVKKPPLTSLLPDWMNPQKPTVKRSLSPLGTPGSKQNWGISLFKFDKGGEVETLQTLFNRISKAYGKPGIKVDGDYGSETEKKRVAILGGQPGITLAQVYKLTLAVEKQAGVMGKPMTMNPYDQSSWLPTSGIPNISPVWYNKP